MTRRNLIRLATGAAMLLICVMAPAFAQTRRAVVMISIDGLRPDYVTAAEHRLRIPN
jgi:hypothetical protein